MKISFLGQGFEDKSSQAIGNHLMNFLSKKGFESFTGISAFASESGIYGLAKYLNIAKSNFKHLNLIVGIDLDGTSKEALEEIYALNINSFIFYQREHAVFHPKIYLFEGQKEFKIIIGSSNLTLGGLFTNVESSLLVEFESNDQEGLDLLIQLKVYYKTLFDFSDPNLFRISPQIISDFYENGIIPDEKTKRNNFHKNSILTIPETDTLAQKIDIPKRVTSQVPSNFFQKIRNLISKSDIRKTLKTNDLHP